MRSLMGGMLVLMCLALVPAGAADLKITIAGLRNSNGVLRLSLFNREDTFLESEGRVASVRLQIWRQPMDVYFVGLPPGTYAVTVHHDEDGDGKINRNLVGIPHEGYGFSNDANGVVGPPSFIQTAVPVEEHDAQITITLRY